MHDFIQPEIKPVDEGTNYGKFVMEPLERGYGITIGNSLRRIMLSSLPGSAVSAIYIDGVLQEFSSIPNVKEDVTEIVMNVKSLHIKNDSENDIEEAYIDFKGEGVVTAEDIKLPANVEIVNKDQKIATLSGGKNSHFSMTLYITKGRGYEGAQRKPGQGINVIPVDALYTPVTRVNSIVEDMRVGESTDNNRLTLEVWTNGTITPTDAIARSARVLDAHLEVLMNLKEGAKDEEIMGAAEETDVPVFKDMPLSDLQLQQRSINCLKRAGIDTLQQLCDKTEADLQTIRNLGRKSLEDILDKVHEQGYKLRSEK